MKHITPKEIQNDISEFLNKIKSAGYDNIDAKVCEALPRKGVLNLTYILNPILRLSHFPIQRQCAEIILTHKPNKPENDVRSYRPISLFRQFAKFSRDYSTAECIPFWENYE